ncbi:hypothetical protein AB6A40_007138 [Gnathostoma spinigerum]|uniref:adenylate cyclase n=1 Tax=Gnathostoma spinigerum TaxID=75299 RepID=A0ABD6EKD6_9BILA
MVARYRSRKDLVKCGFSRHFKSLCVFLTFFSTTHLLLAQYKISQHFQTSSIDERGVEDCVLQCHNISRFVMAGCQETPSTHAEVAYEITLIMLLSICIFHSLLSVEKIPISFIFCSTAIAMLWTFPPPDLTYREFIFWLYFRPNLDKLLLSDQLAVFCSGRNFLSDLRLFFSFAICFTLLLVTIQSRRYEMLTRFDFLWKLQALEEEKEMEKKHAQNRAVLENILPAHVADHFLKQNPIQRRNTFRNSFVQPHRYKSELYHEGRDRAAIVFITITEFDKFYIELDGNNEGVECLRLLNEIIVDFDTQLDREEFKCIEKIKTISTTYMAASGLTGRVVGNTHVVAIARFAMRLLALIQFINQHSFNNFNLRIGINVGPVVAGVIGAKKPHYDIWGNSVNVASRMDSSGVPGKIQVTEETKRILEAEGYEFECRGVINVKGKGEMTTYFLVIPESEKNFDFNKD